MRCNRCARKARAIHPTLRMCHKCYTNPIARDAADFEKWWMK